MRVAPSASRRWVLNFVPSSPRAIWRLRSTIRPFEPRAKVINARKQPLSLPAAPVTAERELRLLGAEPLGGQTVNRSLHRELAEDRVEAHAVRVGPLIQGMVVADTAGLTRRHLAHHLRQHR